MYGLTSLGGRGARVLGFSLSMICILYTLGTFLGKVTSYEVEVSETGFNFNLVKHPDPVPKPDLTTPEVTTLNDEDHPDSARWHSEAMTKIKDKIGGWVPLDKFYGAMHLPWRDHSKSMEPYQNAPAASPTHLNWKNPTPFL